MGSIIKKLFALVFALLFLAGCAGVRVNPASDKTGQQKTAPTQAQSDRNFQDKSGALKVHFLDVGQGDSIFIQLPDGRNMLVDAGPRESEDMVINYLRERAVEKIDFVVGTHPHEDHIGSLDTVIKNFEIGEVFMPKVTTNTRTFRELLLAIQDKGLNIKTAKAGVSIMENGGLKAKLLAPYGTSYESLNNYSAVILLKYGDIAFLLTGDAEGISEKEILSDRTDIKAQVLKVGHHGSNSSTSSDFLKAVSPEYAVISVGAGNDYHHPHPVILNRLEKSGVITLRTDQNGTIVFETDGKTISYATSK